MPKRHSASVRGFTLVELLAVVAIIGILAAVGLVGYRQYARNAKTAETKDLVRQIANGQEAYYQEARGYLSCSSSYTDFYPAKPDKRKRPFHVAAHADNACWRLFHVDADAPTYSGFIAVAGAPGDSYLQPPTVQKVVGKVPDKPWYIVYAASDQDADTTYEHMYTVSLQPSVVHVENVGE
jgi:type IV pilus assembly protein PilA